MTMPLKRLVKNDLNFQTLVMVLIKSCITSSGYQVIFCSNLSFHLTNSIFCYSGQTNLLQPVCGGGKWSWCSWERRIARKRPSFHETKNLTSVSPHTNSKRITHWNESSFSVMSQGHVPTNWVRFYLHVVDPFIGFEMSPLYFLG